MFVCQRCHTTLKVSLDASLRESSLLSFNQYSMPPHLNFDAFNAQEAEAIRQLGESFIVVSDGQTTSGEFPTKEQETQRNSREFHAASTPGVFQPNTAKRINVSESSGRTMTLQNATMEPIGQFGGSTDLDRKVNALTNIFEVASDKCQFDQPVCLECTQSIETELERRVKAEEEDRAVYRAHFEYLTQQNTSQAISEQEAKEEKEEDARLEKEERELEEALAKLMNERKTLAGEEEACEREEKELSIMEERLWKQQQNLEMESEQFKQDYEAALQKVSVAEERLKRLKRANVFDDAFHISTDGHFGTISGFRLGKPPSQKGDWQETNAALGQVVLLLQILAERLDYKYQDHILMPRGSFSKIVLRSNPKTQYELYRTSKIFHNDTRLNKGLVSLLQCILELGERAESLEPGFQQLCKIDVQNGKIGLYELPKVSSSTSFDNRQNTRVCMQMFSIKIPLFETGDHTKALKYMAIALKHLLGFCSAVTIQRQ